ncbi:MAG: carbon storage regulator [Fuerstiella sp.]
MLVLSRKRNEEFRIGNYIVIRVVRITGSRVSLAIDAPKEFHIQRGEMPEYSFESEATTRPRSRLTATFGNAEREFPE